MSNPLHVMFVNPPVIRSTHSSPANNFKIDGPIYKPSFRKIPVLNQIWTAYCRYYGPKNGVRYGVRAGSRWPWTIQTPPGSPHYPFFMAYAASYLQTNNINVSLLDAVVTEEFSYTRFINQVKQQSPDIVILETSTPTIDIDLWMAEQLSPFAEICLSGPHATIWADQILKYNPFVKYILKGEYILNCLEMVQTRRAGIYEPKVVDDLDAIPFPFRDYPGATQYYDPSMPTAQPQLQIYASKGCPFRCIYCMWPQVMYNGTYVPRDPEKVASEIIHCKETYGFKSIFFDDDTFNIGNERISALCDKLGEIGLSWTMMGRLDTSPTWLFDKMVDNGCVGMRFGVETFNIEVSKLIKKGLQSEDVFKTLKHLSEEHPALPIHLTMMKDMPGQTEAIHQEDLRILDELGFSPRHKVHNYQLASCAPFPGTELYNNLVREGNLIDDWQLYDGSKATIMKKLNPHE